MARKKTAAATTNESSPAPLRLEYVDPRSLDENPGNWRTHPAEQTKVLGDVMDKVGWAGALLYNARTCRLVDGHARRKLAIANGVESVPVLIGDWSEEQEKLILTTLDPIAAMAEANAQQLDSLMRDLTAFADSQAISDLITNLAEDAGLIPFDETEARAPKEQREGGEDGDEDNESEGDGETKGSGKKGKPGPETYRDMQSIVEYRIVFDDEEQQDLWFSFLKHLQAKYPNADTIGNRLSLYLNETGIIPEFDEFDDDDEDDDDEDRPPTDFSFGKDDEDDEEDEESEDD
jgi:hypothetical protein